MLVQIAGSHHPWLEEERGPRFSLLMAELIQYWGIPIVL